MFRVQGSGLAASGNRGEVGNRALGLPLVLALLMAGAGCELPDTEPVEEETSVATQSGAETADTATPTADTTANAGTDTAFDSVSVDADQAEWDAIQWYTSSGPSAKGATQVMTLSASVTSDGEFVNFTWNRYPWSDYGLVHFFVWDGTHWKGGKFDWIRTGGQGTKSTENIHERYNGLSIPRSGTAVAFAWTNAKGTQRSNLSKTTWP